MADSDKSIHLYDTGTIASSTLFPIAYLLNAAWATGKISASELGIGLGTKIDFNDLLTDSKTIFGAINELARVSMGTVLSTTLTAGSTSVTFTNAKIKDDSLLDVYTSDMSVVPIDENHTTGSVTYLFEAQSSDITVVVVIRGYSSGGGGGTEYLIDYNDLVADYYIDRSSGQAVSYGGWSCTDYIEVTPNEVLNIASSYQDWYNCWYDNTKTKITDFQTPAIGYDTITVPSTAYYVRFSSTTSAMQRLMLWRDA